MHNLKSYLMLLALIFQIGTTTASEDYHDNRTYKNSYPVVFVHGLVGWGPNEFLGFRYWGGLDEDVIANLNDDGILAMEGVVGPFSSNWDRACELYSYIKGGRVDYGKAHSRKHGHRRYGRRYPGLYPEWGEIGYNDNSNKIHIIAHSMGGQTVRILAKLLESGDLAEVITSGIDNVSPLFSGGKKQISSITTLSSPHDGSTFAYLNSKFFSAARVLLFGLAAMAGINPKYDKNIYDFKLDQWSLRKKSGETLWSYTKRVFSSKIWKSPDICLRDTMPSGARNLNRTYGAQDSVYYFSWATVASTKLPNSKKHRPLVSVLPILMPVGLFIGSYNKKTGEKWYPNDGVVNTISMNGPKLGSNDKIIPFNKRRPRRGAWNFVGTKNKWDHADIIGIGKKNVTPMYRKWIKYLYTLPAN